MWSWLIFELIRKGRKCWLRKPFETTILRIRFYKYY